MMGTGRIHRVRWIGVLTVLTVAGFLLASTIFFGLNPHARFQAQSLVQTVGSMQVGVTTLEDTRLLLKQYQASTLSDLAPPWRAERVEWMDT